MMIYKKRTDKEMTDAEILKIKKEFNLPKIIVKLMAARGYDTSEKIYPFINGKKEPFYDPFLFKDMRKATDRIHEALAKRERILIWGDYDVDGVTSTSTMYTALKAHGAVLSKYNPDRFRDGYGLSDEGVEKILKSQESEQPIRVLITLDCGISEIERINKLTENGIDVIIGDHHLPHGEIPKALAVIDPKTPGETYPYKNLCGAGVAFKMVDALFGRDYAMTLIDYTALGTISDMMDLDDENREIVRYGLYVMNHSPKNWVKALTEALYPKGRTGDITSEDIAFSYGPSINAAGRMQSAVAAVECLTSSDIPTIRKKAYELAAFNEVRKQTQKEILEKCLAECKDDENERFIMAYGENWHHGVIGIVASNILEKYHKPTFVLSLDPETGLLKGSGRSVEGVNLFEAMESCGDIFVGAGGHELAAGLTIRMENLPIFKAKMEEFFLRYDPILFKPTTIYDEVMDIEDIDLNFINDLRILQPCGMGNPSPAFLSDGIRVSDYAFRGDDKNVLSFNIARNSYPLEAVKFKTTELLNTENLRIVYSPYVNTFGGKIAPKIQVSNLNDSGKFDGFDKEGLVNINTLTSSFSDLGVTDKKKKQFEDKNINEPKDLVDFTPRKYLNFASLKTSDQIEDKGKVAIIGRALKVKNFSGKAKGTYVSCKDINGNFFGCSFFNQPYIAQRVNIGSDYVFCGIGSVSEGEKGVFRSVSVNYYTNDINGYQKYMPVYSQIKGMSQDYLQDKIKSALAGINDNYDFLDREILDEFGLVPYKYSRRFIHRPSSVEEIKRGKDRLVFETLYQFNLDLRERFKDMDMDTEVSFSKTEETDKILNNFGFELTEDQNKVLDEIYGIIKSGKRLNSLVQGDVGSGKTIVATLPLAEASKKGYQGAFIAPTTILAKQHFEDLNKNLGELGFKVELLTSETKVRERRAVLKRLENGEIDILIGTHSLFSSDVVFKNLGLIVIDEEHRFGVLQKESLISNPNKPHVITMSATPIPKSLAFATMGDSISLFNIRSRPKGRKPIISIHEKDEGAIYEKFEEEIRNGRQAYVVCPAIEENEKNAEIESVEKVYAEFKNHFEPIGIHVAMITGKDDKKLVEEVMEKFKANEIQILISTTIIEVGVNVPNATVMLLKNGERFGLAQAHQLRGRVGRGSHQSYFIIQTAKENVKADILVSTSDGFKIAEEDLKLRGPGDFLGTLQSGDNEKVSLMLQFQDLYKRIDEYNKKKASGN